MTKLYVVATPIGNLSDITFRAIDKLKECDFIICEDTRVTGKLLHHYKINKKMISLNAYNEKKSLEKLLNKILEVESVCLLSDAGTPSISDPGTRVVNMCRDNQIDIEPIPGPSAIISALSGSGYDTSRFTFLGFLPKKKGRKTLFEEIVNTKETIVFYESNHRILKTLEQLNFYIGERKIGIYKEITKIHEEFISGEIGEILNYFGENPDKIKGEFVVIINSIK